MGGKLNRVQFVNYSRLAENADIKKCKDGCNILKHEIENSNTPQYKTESYYHNGKGTKNFITGTKILNGESAIELLTRLIKKHNGSINWALNNKYWHTNQFMNNFKLLTNLQEGDKIALATKIVDKSGFKIIADGLSGEVSAMAAREIDVAIIRKRGGRSTVESYRFKILNPGSGGATVDYKIPVTWVDNVVDWIS